MRIIATDSSRNISQPLAGALVEQGHAVKVISGKSAKQTVVEVGDTTAIDSLKEESFLVCARRGSARCGRRHSRRG